MDKYAVVEHSPPHKQASDTRRCPVCGEECVEHGSVALCPTHGSAPFESSESDGDE